MLTSKQLISQLAEQLVAEAQRLDQAHIYAGQQNPPEVQEIILDLSEARSPNDPLQIGFPFKSLFVASATTTSSTVRMRAFSKDAQQSSFPLTKRDSITFQNPITQAFLDWDAGVSGDQMIIYVFRTGEFRSGSQISVNAGGVSINDGSTISSGAAIVLSAGVAGIIAEQFSDRKVCTLQNDTGDVIYIGDSAISSGSNYGIEIPNKQIWEYRNTAALYAISAGGGNVRYMEQYD